MWHVLTVETCISTPTIKHFTLIAGLNWKVSQSFQGYWFSTPSIQTLIGMDYSFMQYFNADFDPFLISFYVRIEVFEIKFQRAFKLFQGSVFIGVEDKKLKFSAISCAIFRILGSLAFEFLLGSSILEPWDLHRHFDYRQETHKMHDENVPKKHFFLLSYLSKNIPGSRTYYTSIHTFLVTSSTTKICKSKRKPGQRPPKFQIVFHTLLFDASCQSKRHTNRQKIFFLKLKFFGLQKNSKTTFLLKMITHWIEKFMYEYDRNSRIKIIKI